MFTIEGNQCREKEIDGHIQIRQFTLAGYFQRKIKKKHFNLNNFKLRAGEKIKSRERQTVLNKYNT